MDEETEAQNAHVTCVGPRPSWRQSQAPPEPEEVRSSGGILQREGEAAGEAAGPQTPIY